MAIGQVLGLGTELENFLGANERYTTPLPLILSFRHCIAHNYLGSCRSLGSRCTHASRGRLSNFCVARTHNFEMSSDALLLARLRQQ